MRGWHPLSAETRAIMASEPDKWDYVELWDGAAAQAVVFGVTARRAPDLFTMLEPVEKPDPAQTEMDL